jgi:hypothetical protein
MHVTDQPRPQLREGRVSEMPGWVIVQRELISVVEYRVQRGTS